MISHITLFSLSVLFHGKTPAAGNWATSDALRAVQAAWVWADLPSGAPANSAQSNGGLSERSIRGQDHRDLDTHAFSNGSFVVLANSGQSFVEEGEEEGTDVPDTGAIDEDEDQGEDETASDASDAIDSKTNAPVAAPPVVKTQSVVSPVRYDDSMNEDDSFESDETDLEEPLITDDIEVSPSPTGSPPPDESALEEDADEEDAVENDVDDDNAGDNNADKDEAEEEADFPDFGSTYTMPGGTKPNITHSKTETMQPASTNHVPTDAAQVEDVESPPASGSGLSTQLRSGISIARMTLKDQPSELIRVSVNTSMVVDLSGPVDGANIVDPNVADIIVPAPNRIIVVGKSTGTTQLVLTIGQGQAQEHRVFHVYVEPNVVVLSDLIRSLAPRSDIRIGSLNGQLVLQGNVPDTQTAKQIEELARAYQGRDAINHLMVSGTQQTLLRVVVAEVNKEALRNLGFNWAIGASDWSRDFFFANNLGNLNPTTFGSSGLANVLQGQQLYGVNAVGNGANTNVSFGFPKAELQIFMNALRTNGLARTLAEPNLVAISGQTATFLAGGEVPIPVSQGGAVAGAITIEYKEFGVRLAFTPTVGADQIIRLHVMSEVSDAVPGSRQIDTIPVFTFRTRRVESTVECPNGKTFAIAGLLNETVNAIASKIPGLGDVPVLGQLFSSVDYQRSNTELVVLVTPNLVEALEPEQVPPPPGQMMQHPDDWELFGLGQLEGSAPPSPRSTSAVPSESQGGTLVHRDSRTKPMHARLQGNWGIEDQEPGALAE
ncbi:MAG: pilus assembly protein N-terminal domain-containing protein [Planctomycetes bacterium]|nr:pilus assembly protein N-terminal domain-containing protein [Planctomycetota bacterium]